MRPPTSTVVVVLWLSVQMLLPAYYYVVSAYTDPLDEMYAWRMFSATHNSASFVEWYALPVGTSRRDGYPLDLQRDAGLGRIEAKALTGTRKNPTSGRAPPLWMMERVATFVCQNRTIGAVGARRVFVPWEGELEEEELAWPCK